MCETTLYLNKFFLFCTTLISVQAFAELEVSSAYDVVIYGGTSSGVIAASQASKMGKSVVIIEPGKHLGGMTSSGLGWVDITQPKAIGGLTSKYFNHVWQYYQRDSSWTSETKHPFKGQLMHFYPTDPRMWVLEPHVGEMIFKAIASEAKCPVIYNEQLNRTNGVHMEGKRIVGIVMESGRTFTGKIFIDATYEGDLMAASGISYVVGREPNNRYNETLNGIHLNSSDKSMKIDPYVVKGDPESGLLPRISSNLGGNPGDGDKGVQAYNYRMCLTDVPQNRIQIEKPIGYNESEYELLFRLLENHPKKEMILPLHMLPNRKTDLNNSGIVSTDYIGMNWIYPEADYATRDEIAAKHEQWQRGLIWTLQNHPRVPLAVQQYCAPWGLAKDEFIDNNNWPYMLYVREAKRMVSTFVIDEQTVLGNIAIPDNIGLGTYNMDSHFTQYVVGSNGYLATDGGMSVLVKHPYPISYRAIVPRVEECENLLVPACLSATHVAYGSLRIESTLMVLGQSAATAASLAIDLNVPVQNVPYEALSQQLLADGQILDFSK